MTLVLAHGVVPCAQELSMLWMALPVVPFVIGWAKSRLARLRAKS